ncbi:DUF3085 domain-containing protein [Bradyrhizobium septentrionale]|uniref:DUF3085 domain-containing protein n=1 Tax=Bradyrhizobium septentrionale TaxID=1404411 RepID=A0ABZ2P7P2_9BRAD
MSNLIFKAADVLRVVEHTLAAPKQCAAFTGPVTEPSILLVHDEGVYLMSNGEPRDIAEGERSYVAHALGCNPKIDSDWYDTSRDLVGGDDFGEALPWAAEIKQQIEQGAQEIIITLTADSLELQQLPSRKH